MIPTPWDRLTGEQAEYVAALEARNAKLEAVAEAWRAESWLINAYAGRYISEYGPDDGDLSESARESKVLRNIADAEAALAALGVENDDGTSEDEHEFFDTD